jgi:hypothetical protein
LQFEIEKSALSPLGVVSVLGTESDEDSQATKFLSDKKVEFIEPDGLRSCRGVQESNPLRLIVG